MSINEFPCLHCGGRHQASHAEAIGGSTWPMHTCPNVDMRDTDWNESWDRWIAEGEPRIRWTGDHLARLIWVCLECGATGDGETQTGIDAANQHRTACEKRT